MTSVTHLFCLENANRFPRPASRSVHTLPSSLVGRPHTAGPPDRSQPLTQSSPAGTWSPPGPHSHGCQRKLPLRTLCPAPPCFFKFPSTFSPANYENSDLAE